MENMSLKMVKSYLESKEAEPQIVAEDLLAIGWGFNGGTIKVFFKFNNENNVSIVGTDFIQIPEDKIQKMYKIVNDANRAYRHVKFCIEPENGQMEAAADAIIQIDSCGEECFELMIRIVGVVQDAYPVFMKAIWG